MYRKIGSYKAEFGTNENGRVTIKNGAVTVSQDMEKRTPDADFEALIYGRQKIIILTDRLSQDPEGMTDIGPMEFDDAADELNWAKARKREEIAAARYAEEISGVTVNGMTIRTDRESQALITGAALQAVEDPTYICQWKAETGFVTLTAEQIKGAAQAVRAHVQGCFDKEAAAGAAIDAATTKAEVEAVTWESIS